MKTKKEIKQEYKSMKFRQGIFQIVNLRDNRMYLGISSDLDRAFNSDKFKLNAGMHSNKQLQKDWDSLGAESFEYAVLDELKVDGLATPAEIKQDLKELLEMHLTEMRQKEQLMYE
jgi:hypothetical protein